MTTKPGEACLGFDVQPLDTEPNKNEGADRAAITNQNHNTNIISGTVGVLINNNPVTNNIIYGDAPKELVRFAS